MDIISIDVHLSVEVKDQGILAHLLFTNNTTDLLNLDKVHICSDGQFWNDVFEILDEKGKKVSYIGGFVNRRRGEKDFILLKKGEKIKVTINLNDGYKLIKGKKYIVQYDTFNPGLSEDLPLMVMKSNKAEVLYK
jgi:hypothetical protein